MNSAGLYIHIPFCQHKCGYCDFYSVTRLELLPYFLQALEKEVALRAPQFQDVQFDTIFLGGGTPSLLSTEQIGHLWDLIHRHFHISAHGEFTIEANPGTLSRKQLHFLHQLGFNRLSIGVQSFQDAELRFLERIHTAQQAVESFFMAREAGFQNINLDLMMAFPGQTFASFQASLEKAVQLRPEHLSCYTLILEPHTPFYRRWKNGQLTPVDEETEVAFYQQAFRFLKDQGYQPYEISNFARENRWQCRHNLIYWNYRPYLGLGPSAHSFWQGKRWANVRSITDYIRKLEKGQFPLAFQETLTEQQQKLEFIYLHLRLQKGIARTEYQKLFGSDIWQDYGPVLQKLKQDGLIAIRKNRVQLTQHGWLLVDSIATHF